MVIRLLQLVIIPMLLSISLSANSINDGKTAIISSTTGDQIGNEKSLKDSVTENSTTNASSNATNALDNLAYKASPALSGHNGQDGKYIGNTAFKDNFSSAVGTLYTDKGGNKSVINAKDSVVSIVTTGKATTQLILTATDTSDANNNGESLAFSVIKTKDSVVSNNTTVNTNEVTADTTKFTRDTLTKDMKHYSTVVDSDTNLKDNTKTVTYTNAYNIENTAGNGVVAYMNNNTEKNKTKTTATILANSSFNSDTIGAANRAFQDGDKKSVGYTKSA